MKKGQTYEGLVEKVEFPNKGIVRTEEEKVIVKNSLPGQKVLFRVNKKRKGKCEGALLQVLEKGPKEMESPCPHFGTCGGCSYQSLPYEEQLLMKETQMKEIFRPVLGEKFDEVFEGIKGSPVQFEYRNKMEFTFGDVYKDGPLALGMHKRGSFYDIVSVTDCQIMDADYRAIVAAVLAYFTEKGYPYMHRMSHIGFLRHLLVRKAQKTGEILVALITTSQMEPDLSDFVTMLTELPLKGKIVGILHTKNDSLADVVQSDETNVLYGQDYFYEELLGLKFKISQFSFFQTNSLGAEVLYETTREFLGNINEDGKTDKTVFDLYSGTGTIAQLLAPVAKKVIGVEIVEEAVEAAKKNAGLNGLSNCEFIAGDVLKVIDDIKEKPDFIILDPPRDGIHPKALPKIIDYGVDRIVYVSCKPTSLARDLEVFQNWGYEVKRLVAVDQFPGTVHCESIALLQRTH